MSFYMKVIPFKANPKLIFNFSKACNEDIYPQTSYMEATLTSTNKKLLEVLFRNSVLTVLISVRKYNVIPGDCSRVSNVRTLVFRNKVGYQNPASLQNPIWKRSTFK
jgi:hypothetical protein